MWRKVDMGRKKKIVKLLRSLIYFVYILLYVSPILIMLNTSLKKYEDIIKWPPTWFTGKLEWINYQTVLFGEKSIIPALRNSFAVSVSSAFICIIIAIPAAYAVARYKFRLRKEVMLIIILTQMFSEVILAAPMYMVFKHLKLLDTRAVLIIANCAVCLPMSLWLLYSYLQDIPKELEEAAWVDGCSRLEGIRHILAPLILPGIITASLFAFIRAYGDLLFARTFILSPENRTIAMALTDFQSLYKTTWETQMAASFISMLPTLFIFIFIQKFLVKGIIGDSVKG
jgi:sugar ABC transporter permease protein